MIKKILTLISFLITFQCIGHSQSISKTWKGVKIEHPYYDTVEFHNPIIIFDSAYSCATICYEPEFDVRKHSFHYE